MFTENQSRQLYVATSTAADVIAPVQLDSSTSATDLTAKSAGACQFIITSDGEEAYFTYKGPSDDGLQRTDRIGKCNIIDIRATAAEDMRHIKKKLLVALDSNVSSTAESGQDYVLNINIFNYIANGDDSIKSKYGVARATSTTASDLYKKLAISLAKNFSREPVDLLKITLAGDANNTEITSTTTTTDLTSITATGIYLEEVEQPWRRGAAPQEFVNFEAIPSTIYVDGSDQVWGTVTDVTASNTSSYIVNSKKVADMEYFFHKERGDKYGYACFPYNIDTTYLVDPADTSGYSFVDIHYYSEGNSMNVGKSEKTITFVGTESNLKKLIGSAAAGNTAATGLYAFIDGTNVTIKTSANW